MKKMVFTFWPTVYISKYVYRLTGIFAMLGLNVVNIQSNGNFNS